MRMQQVQDQISKIKKAADSEIVRAKTLADQAIIEAKADLDARMTVLELRLIDLEKKVKDHNG
jgi:hypothetical protein